MNYRTLIILIISLIVQTGNSQTFTYKSLSLKSLNLGNDVELEAQQKQISKDVVHISFIINKDCDPEDYKISIPGKLKSFNLVVEKESKYILSEFFKQHPCNGEKAEYVSIPISMSFSN